MNTSEIKPAFVDYRLVPNYTDHAAVESALQQISQKFKTDGAAVAATFAIEDDPREAVTAVSRRFTQMIESNAQDDDCCAWLRSAQVGEWFPGVVAVQRVR